MHTTLTTSTNAPFESAFRSSPFILTEGAIVERLRHEFHVPLDQEIVHAALIYDKKYRDILALIYRQYLDIAELYQLPIMLMTPTRRVNSERTAKSKFKDKAIIADNVTFLQELKKGYQTPVYIGGLTGCKGDAYSDESLSIEEAIHFHQPTLELYQKAGVDFLFAGIMPALPESIGMAKAMEATHIPYIISYMVRKNGTLIDGASIHQAIAEAESATMRHPLCYMANCIHPDLLLQALSAPANNTPLVKSRFCGIQANAACLSPEELDECCNLQSSSPKELAERMQLLHQSFPLKIYGGCCGTDQHHLQEVAILLRKLIANID